MNSTPSQNNPVDGKSQRDELLDEMHETEFESQHVKSYGMGYKDGWRDGRHELNNPPFAKDVPATPPSQAAAGGTLEVDPFDTPRTDAAAKDIECINTDGREQLSWPLWARRLERELNEANARVAKALLVGKTDWDNKLATLTVEKDEAKRALFVEEQNRNQLACLGHENAALRQKVETLTKEGNIIADRLKIVANDALVTQAALATRQNEELKSKNP